MIAAVYPAATIASPVPAAIAGSAIRAGAPALAAMNTSVAIAVAPVVAVRTTFANRVSASVKVAMRISVPTA